MSLLTQDRPPAPAEPAPDRTPTPGPGRARWERPALAVLLVGTGVLYLWGLGASGWANSFYAAAAQAGSESWTAFFFGSSDAANAITVDKTPLSLWPMALSIRVFGLSSWSLLVPQALEGVAAVGLLYATVRRTTGSAAAGLVAGAVLATTPVAVLMFRFDNPDALLTLLLVGSAYATLRAVETRLHPVRWLALAGALVGLAFLTKMLQAFLVVPALGLVYLLFAHTSLPKRLGHLLVGLGAMVASAGWWVAIVSLWPASSRPYIGGSQENSILELTLGYNGFGRLTGDETGSVGGGGAGGGMWGETGLGRLLDDEIGGQIGWLLPTALVLLVAGLWLTRRAPRTGRAGSAVRGRAGALGGLAGRHGRDLQLHGRDLPRLLHGRPGPRDRRPGRHRSLAALAAPHLAVRVLRRERDRLHDHRPGLLPARPHRGLRAVAALGRPRLWAGDRPRRGGSRALPRRVAGAVAAAALVVSLAGPAAYAVQTAATPHTGSIPSAGPATAGGFGGGPGGGAAPTGAPPTAQQGTAGAPTGGGAGGLLNASEPTAAVTALLQTDADRYTWVAAAVGSNSASGYQLASEEPVMAIGGFNGSDPSPTLAEFQAYVAAGDIHWFIASGGGFGGSQMGGSSASSDIAAWVEATFTATTVDGVTLYDLTGS